MSLAREQVHIDHQRTIGGEVRQLQLGVDAVLAGCGDRAVACLGQRDSQLIEIDQAQAQLAAERRGHPLRRGNEGRRSRDLQLGKVLFHLLVYSVEPPLVAC